MITANGVSYAVAERLLVDRVDAEISPGAVTAIAGPNGAGKSTLLRLLAGGVAPSAGDVRLCGRALGEWSPAALARRRAVVTQFTQVAFPFTVTEIVTLGRAPYRRTETRVARDDAVRRAMTVVGVEPLARRLFLTLSGGEQQRVMLARALAQLDVGGADAEPRCLLLDEPTASLDLYHQHHVLALTRQLAASGHTIVVVLHDINDVLRYADEVLLMSNGSLQAAGAAAATLTRENVDAVFGVAVDFATHRDGRRVFIVEGAAAGGVQ